MQLVQPTEPAASQLALLRLLRRDIPSEPDPKPSPLVSLLRSEDFLPLFLKTENRFNSDTATRTILGFCNLFSCCKGIRKFSGILISWARACCLSSLPFEHPDFDWRRMEHCSVGEHLCWLAIFLPTFLPARLQFQRELSVVSTRRAPDFHSFRARNGDHIRTWLPAMDDITHAFFGLFVRFQEDGDLYVLAKLGLFSSQVNRDFGVRAVESILEFPGRYIEFVNEGRLRALLSLLRTSYGIMDLNPEIVGIDMEQVFPYATLLTGFHPGLDCRYYNYSTADVSLGVVHLLRNE
jgi:hypothetical protein